MFSLNRKIASDVSSNLKDVANVKFALTALGYHDDTDTGLSAYPNDDLFHSIKSFQKDNDLEVDGVINTDGPTQEKIKSNLIDDKTAGNAFDIFRKNRDDMVDANTIGTDKYFHCKANHEAASQGWLGKIASEVLSAGREIIFAPKEIAKIGLEAAMEDSGEDSGANAYGRENAERDSSQSARDVCSVFRPKALDDKY